jgi:hypothetical protein
VKKRNRWTSRRQIEVETSLTTIPTDVMSENSHGLHSLSKRDETEKLTRLRRQAAQAGPASPAAAPQPDPAPKKRRGWRRFFGL